MERRRVLRLKVWWYFCAGRKKGDKTDWTLGWKKQFQVYIGIYFDAGTF
jgi:hypothetical protein